MQPPYLYRGYYTVKGDGGVFQGDKLVLTGISTVSQLGT
jgi:hypothetical protein